MLVFKNALKNNLNCMLLISMSYIFQKYLKYQIFLGKYLVHRNTFNSYMSDTNTFKCLNTLKYKCILWYFNFDPMSDDDMSIQIHDS